MTRHERRPRLAGDDRPARRADRRPRLRHQVGRRRARCRTSRRKVHLNRGELPLPRDAAGHTKPESSAAGAFLNPDPYDLNDDGVFDVTDYADRPARRRPQRQRPARSAGSDPDLQRRHRRRRQRLRRRHRRLELPRRRQRPVRRGRRTATARARRRTRPPRPTTAAPSAPARTAASCRSASATASSPTRTSSRRAWCSRSTAARTSCRRRSARSTTPSFAHAAIDYAWSNDVPVIASAADEESFHHNVPVGQPPHDHGELGDPLRRAVAAS